MDSDENADDPEDRDDIDSETRQDASTYSMDWTNQALPSPNTHMLTIDTRFTQHTPSRTGSSSRQELPDTSAPQMSLLYAPPVSPSAPFQFGGPPYFVYPGLYAAPPTPASSTGSIPPSPRYPGTPSLQYSPSPLPFYLPGLPASPSSQFSDAEIRFMHPREGSLFKDVNLVEYNGGPSWWIEDSVSETDQCLVAWRCLKRSGFESLGHFWSAMLNGDHGTSQSLTQAIAAFVQRRSRAGTHPADIIELIYSHRQSENYMNGKPVPPVFPSLPVHAIPPGVSTDGQDNDAPISTKTTMLEWALNVIMDRIDQEADKLLSMKGEFTIREHLTWDMLLNFDFDQKKALIAKEVCSCHFALVYC